METQFRCKSSLVIFILSALFLYLTANSDENYVKKPSFHIGAFMGYNLNYLATDFNSIPGVEFSQINTNSGTGRGFSYAGLFKKDLSKTFTIELRASLIDQSSNLSENQNIGMQSVRDISPPNDVRQTEVIVDHTVESILVNAGAELTFGYKFIGGLNLLAGLRAAYSFTSRFNQFETIEEPANVTFLNNEIYRYRFTDIDIPDKNSLLFFGVIGICYDINITSGIRISPDIRYYMPFSSSSKSLGWRTSTLTAGLAIHLPIFPGKDNLKNIKYIRDTTSIEILGLKGERIYLENSSEKLALEERPDANIIWTIVYESYKKEIPKPAIIESSIDVVGIHDNGTRESNPTIIIEEVEYIKETVPLLPYIFFKEGNSDISSTDINLLTERETTNFSDDSLKPKALVAYTELLNIVGFRLNKYPNAKLTIVGCNNDLGIEKANSVLSKGRAEVVRDYLINIWKINPSRIDVIIRNLPLHPANNSHIDGQRENQRVELYSDDENVLAHILIKFTTKQTKIPSAEIYPKAFSEAGIKEWTISVTQKGNPIRNYNGKETVTPVLKWDILEEPIPEINEKVAITITATDNFNQSSSAETHCKVLHKHLRLSGDDIRGGVLVEKFYVIAHFGSPDIIANQMSFFEHIKSRIRPHSKVTVAGYADRTGTLEINKKLAERRVNQVQSILKVKSENLQKLPIGSEILLYDNDLPQGRCYSRTIQVTIETYID